MSGKSTQHEDERNPSKYEPLLPKGKQEQVDHSSYSERSLNAGAENRGLIHYQTVNNDDEGGDIERDGFQKNSQSNSMIQDREMSLAAADIISKPHTGNPLDRYNMVISQYNNPTNMVEGLPLSQLKPSALVGWLHKLVVLPKWRISAMIVMLLASGFNLFLLIVYVVGFVKFWLRSRVANENERIVPDPFCKMIFCQEICESLATSTHYFNIRLNQMEQFSFNFDTMEFIKKRLTSEQEVKFMVYDVQFFSNYSQFESARRRFKKWFVGFLLLVAINYLVVYLLYNAWFHHYF